MIKKINLLSLVLLVSIFYSCSKDPELKIPKVESKSDILIEEAKTIGLSFINDIQKKQTRNSYAGGKKIMSVKPKELDPTKKSVEKVTTVYSPDQKPVFYVINYKPSGYTIVSATKKTDKSIIAFSDVGQFDYELAKTKLGISTWLENASNEISKLRDGTESAISKDIVQNATNATILSYPVQVGPLLNSAWAQGVGYNNAIIPDYMDPPFNCTQYSNGKPPVGCVAVAMVQVMYYWKYPNKPGYFWPQVDIENAGGVGGPYISYNLWFWADLLHMDFNCSGSGTQTSYIVNLLKNTVPKYNQAIRYINYDLGTVVSNLSNLRPVIIDGFPTTGAGHAWVCDGYMQTNATTTYLHNNWGWGGYLNGWFLAGDFTPYIGSDSFNTNNRMVVDIYP